MWVADHETQASYCSFTKTVRGTRQNVMKDLFEKDINERIKAVPFDAAWWKNLHDLLKEKNRITK